MDRKIIILLRKLLEHPRMRRHGTAKHLLPAVLIYLSCVITTMFYMTADM